MAWRHVESRPGLPAVHFAFSGADDGDLAVDVPAAELDRRRTDVMPGPWTWLRQVHGADVVQVEEPGQHAGAHADASVTTVPGAVLAVQTADCAGVLLLGTGPDSVAVAAAHAGWRGLVDGVLQEAVGHLRAAGATKVEWLLGPCIGPASYEFGEHDLAVLVGRYGPSLAATTADGSPALDLRAGVRIALAEVGAHPLAVEGWRNDAVPCTATDDGPDGPRWFSWRARKDAGRQVAAVRIGEWPA